MDSLRSKLKRRREDCSRIRRDNRDDQAQLDRVERYFWRLFKFSTLFSQLRTENQNRERLTADVDHAKRHLEKLTADNKNLSNELAQIKVLLIENLNITIFLRVKNHDNG